MLITISGSYVSADVLERQGNALRLNLPTGYMDLELPVAADLADVLTRAVAKAKELQQKAK